MRRPDAVGVDKEIRLTAQKCSFPCDQETVRSNRSASLKLAIFSESGAVFSPPSGEDHCHLALRPAVTVWPLQLIGIAFEGGLVIGGNTSSVYLQDMAFRSWPVVRQCLQVEGMGSFAMKDCSLDRCRVLLSPGGLSAVDVAGFTAVNWGEIAISGTRFSGLEAVEGPLMSFLAVYSVKLSRLSLTSGGGVRLRNVDTVAVEDSAFLGLARPAGGAALDVSDVFGLTASNCTFADGEQTLACLGCGGGAVLTEKSTVAFVDCRFRRLFAASAGGAVLLGLQTSASFLRSTFEDCGSVGDGGAIFAVGSEVDVDSCRFQNVSSLSGAGGAVSVNLGSLSAENTAFFGATALSGGAVAAGNGVALTMRNVTVSNGSAEDFGGALNIVSMAAIGLQDVRISDVAAGYGGAIGVSSLSASASCAMNGLAITGAAADVIGGSILLSEASCSIRDSRVSQSSVDRTFGGGLAAERCGLVTVRNSTFDSCTASDGGAVYARNSELRLVNSTIQEGFASYTGGGIKLSSSSLTIQESAVVGCAAGSNGGAVHAEFDSYVSVISSTVANSSSGALGGAVFTDETSAASFNGSTLEGNAALVSGGCLHSSRPFGDDGAAFAVDSLFAKNSASALGGCFCLEGQATVAFDNRSTFVNNSAGRGGAVYFETAEMPANLVHLRRNSSGNTATEQGGFAASGPVKLGLVPTFLMAHSSRPTTLTVQLLDFFGNVVKSADHTCVRLDNSWETATAILGGAAAFDAGEATMTSLTIMGHPGSMDGVKVIVEGYNLTKWLYFSLFSCKTGEILHKLECVECEYGSYSYSPLESACTDCPDGAVCVNGSQVIPRWGYWFADSVRPICEGDDCRVPLCPVLDACHGPVPLVLDWTSRKQLSPLEYSVEVSSGALHGQPLAGTGIMIDRLYWMTVAGGNRTGGKLALHLAIANGTAWPSIYVNSVEAMLFLPADCSEGYTGRLCAACSKGYGRVANSRCGRCLGAAVTVLLSAAAGVAAIVIVAALSLLTIRNAGKRGSQLVSIAKILWSYLQLMDTASSVNSRQFLSLDCLLEHLGINQGGSLAGHSLLVFLFPVAILALAAVVWTAIHHRRTGHRELLDPSKFEVTSRDKFSITAITLLFLLYPNLCHSAFSLFPCEQVGGGEWFMSLDLETSCGNGAAIAVGVIGAAVYAVGVPVLSFLLVWRRRRALKTRYAANTVGFLYLGYSDRCYYFESVVLLKKMLFGALILLSRTLSGTILVSIALLLFGGSYVLQVELKPFEEHAIDRLERLSSLGILLFLLGGLAFESSVGEAAILAIAAALVAVNVVFLGTVWRLMAPQLREQWRAAKKSRGRKGVANVEVRNILMEA